MTATIENKRIHDIINIMEKYELLVILFYFVVNCALRAIDYYFDFVLLCSFFIDLLFCIVLLIYLIFLHANANQDQIYVYKFFCTIIVAIITFSNFVASGDHLVIRLGLNVALTHQNRSYRDSETKGNVEEQKRKQRGETDRKMTATTKNKRIHDIINIMEKYYFLLFYFILL